MIVTICVYTSNVTIIKEPLHQYVVKFWMTLNSRNRIGPIGNLNYTVTNNLGSNYPSLSVKDHLPGPSPLIITPLPWQTGYHHIVSHNFGNIHTIMSSKQIDNDSSFKKLQPTKPAFSLPHIKLQSCINIILSHLMMVNESNY